VDSWKARLSRKRDPSGEGRKTEEKNQETVVDKDVKMGIKDT